MPEPFELVIIAGTFLLAGTVKGVIGLGLPTVSLALLAVAFDLPTAMALLLVPSFTTNLWQASLGGHAKPLLLRLWPFLLLATCTVWLGASALAHVDLKWLSALLGVLLVAYAALSLAGVRIKIGPGRERTVGVLMGATNGVLTGMTGSFVVPGVLYLQATGLARDALVQAMGILFTLSTLALAVALQRNRLLDAQTLWLSAAAVLPAIVGMLAGSRIRRRLSEAAFRKVFFICLLLLGSYIISRALSGLA